MPKPARSAEPFEPPARPARSDSPKSFAHREGASPVKKAGDLLAWKRRSRQLGLPAPPQSPIPVVEPDLEAIHQHASHGAAPLATWIGHSTVLLQTNGLALLTDPIFSERCSPLSFAGPKRRQSAAIEIARLPRIDAVMVSHDHYDHLDERSVKALARQRGGPPLFIVPLGLGAWMSKRGIPAIELDWWDSQSIPTRAGPLDIMLAPAAHWSGRSPGARHQTLWGSFCVLAPDTHAYFAGDTAYSPHFSLIREKLAPRQTPSLGGGFDLCLLPIGSYEPRWFMKRQHIDPAEAAMAHAELGSKQSLAIHWGTFALSDESLDEPPRRLAIELARAGIPMERFLHIPIGGSVSIPRRGPCGTAMAS